MLWSYSDSREQLTAGRTNITAANFNDIYSTFRSFDIMYRIFIICVYLELAFCMIDNWIRLTDVINLVYQVSLKKYLTRQGLI
jgi:hypothetical protein